MTKGAITEKTARIRPCRGKCKSNKISCL